MDSLPQKPLIEIFKYLDDPSSFARLSQKYYYCSQDSRFRAQWLLHRPRVLESWATKKLEKRPMNYPEWIALHSGKAELSFSTPVDEQSTQFPGRIITKLVCQEILKQLSVQLSTAKGDQSFGLRNVLNAAVSKVCEELWLPVWIAAISPSPHLQTQFDEVCWKSVVYFLITESTRILAAVPATEEVANSELDLAYSEMEKVVLIQKELWKMVPDATSLAVVANNLDMLDLMVRVGGFPLRSKADILKRAAETGDWEIANYVVSMDGFTEEQVSLIKMFHDIYLLEQTRNADMATKVAEVLDHWRSESNKAFLIRWKIAMEHACEKGEYNLVYHLLKAYANLIKDRPIITLRMVAMAVEAKSDAIFELLLEYTTRDSTIGPRNPDEVVINPLNKLNSDPKIRREQLLWRYCRITNQELAQQLGASFAGINCKANVNLHRRQVVAHLLDPPQPATQPGVDVVANSKLGQDCIWSSVGLGVLDISRQLREKGVNLDWMEDDHVEIQQEEQQKEANSLNLKTVLEPVAVALYAALGGAWERGTEVAPSHGPERNEIEKIINNTSAVVKAASVGNSVSDLRDDILELQGRTSVAEGRSSTLRRRATLRATAPRHTGRILIDPSDTVWTAFLSGKLEEVSKLMDERGSTDIGWMEPAAKLSAAENEERKAVTSSAEKLSNDTKATFGEETPDDAAISFFMALGGRI